MTEWLSIALFSSVQLLSYVWLFATPCTAALQLPCPSPTLGACSNSCPSSRWCHPTISSSIVPFFSCLQSFPASESFLRSQFFTSGGQSIRASAWVLPVNIQDWFHQQSCVKEEKDWWRLFSNVCWFYIWTSSKISLVCKFKDCKCLITLYVIIGLYVQKIIRNIQ